MVHYQKDIFHSQITRITQIGFYINLRNPRNLRMKDSGTYASDTASFPLLITAIHGYHL